MNICTLIVPIKCVQFYELILPLIVNYLTNYIKSISPVVVPNEIKYKLYIYVHQNHPQFQTLYNHPLIFFENNYYKKSSLQRDLGDNYTQGIIHLYYNEQWELIPLYNKNLSNPMITN